MVSDFILKSLLHFVYFLEFNVLVNLATSYSSNKFSTFVTIYKMIYVSVFSLDF